MPKLRAPNACSLGLSIIGLALALIAGCATPSQSGQQISIDTHAWKSASFVELTSVDGHAHEISYLESLPGAEAGAPKLVCRHRTLPSGQRSAISAWVWRSKELVEDPARQTAFLDQVHRHGITTLYVQWQPDLSRFDALLRAANASGIAIKLVAGEPSDVLDPEPLLRVADSIRRYNATHPLRFTGLQLDVEPYLLPEFRRNESGTLARYVELLKKIRGATVNQYEFSVAMPFWFADKPLDGGNMMSAVMPEVDRIAIMGYRTRLDEQLDIDNNALCYGELYGKPVDLGLEVTKLPREDHYVIATSKLSNTVRSSDGTTILQYDPREFDRIATRHWTVEPSRLSFYPDIDAAFATTRTPIPYTAFSGWSINGLDDAWLQR
jgi:hypothetical protein